MLLSDDKFRFLCVEASDMQLRRFYLLTLLFLSIFFSPPALGNDSTFTSQQLKDQYSKKLEELGLEIPVYYTTAVRQIVLDLLQNSQRKTSQTLTKARLAYEQLGHYFDSAGFPKELALLAVVNSDFYPSFVNKNTGASGVWPLTFSVAKRYGLKTNSFVDQRRNIHRSAKAMIQYLTDLENIYQDWHFVITAYYAGPINLNMAIRKAGNTLVYERVHEAMEASEKLCLERFMALLYVFHFHADHQITYEKPKIASMDTVCTAIALNLNFVAEKLDFKKTTLREINPDFLTPVVPVIPDCNCFTLPIEFADKYREMRAEIEIKEIIEIDSTASDSLATDSLNIEATVKETSSPTTPTGVPRDVQVRSDKVLIYYTVKSGDNLGLIAKLFDTSVKQIQTWNNMRNTLLYAGNKLKIYVPSGKEAEYKKINSMTMPQKQALARRK